MRSHALLAAVLCLLPASCGRPQTPPPPAAPPTPQATAEPTAPELAPAATVAITPPQEPPPPSSPPDAPSVELGRFVLSLDQPVASLALGEPRVAALGRDPWLFEKGAWKKIPFPERLRPREGERDDGRIFFGRDDRPRIMGTRHQKAGPVQLYMRWRNATWNEERGEIAKLREPPPAGMWGVLGHADPEVVCKVSSDCIIKRRTGWKMMSAGTGSPRVKLHDGIAWALGDSSVAWLRDDHEWVTLSSPAAIEKPGGVWGTADEAWVSEPTTGKLHHLLHGTWTSEVSPIALPRGMWGRKRDDIWLAGGGGLSHYDGKTWSRVSGPTGPLAEVHGRGAEVWAAGESGVWSRGGT